MDWSVVSTLNFRRGFPTNSDVQHANVSNSASSDRGGKDAPQDFLQLVCAYRCIFMAETLQYVSVNGIHGRWQL